EGDALTRKAVEMALAGNPTAFALRVCLERVVGPYCEGVAEFTMPPIEGPRAGKSCGPRHAPEERRGATGCGGEDRSSCNPTGGFAADLLQVQPLATIGSIDDCRPWSRRIAEDRVLHLVAGCDAEACRGAAVQLDHLPNRCSGGNRVERLRHGALADVDDPAL